MSQNNRQVAYDGKRHPISLTIPDVLLLSIKLFIKRGRETQIETDRDAFDAHPTVTRIDITSSELIRYLLTTDYDKETAPGEYLFEAIVQKDTHNEYVHISTNNPLILSHRTTSAELTKRLIYAMVWHDIPIVGYFDGKHVL